MFRFPHAPAFFHAFFMHAVLLTAVAILCLIGGLAQVREGLASIDRLRAKLAALHTGREPRVDGEYPAEIQPLVTDLNALLEHREQTVRRAQARAGDLAHGLKTPLAVLAHEADRAGAAGQPELAAAVREQIEAMRRQVDYHLARARAAAGGAAPGARTLVGGSAEALARTLRRLHAERGVTIDVQVPAGHAVRVQREDLDEMLGNLLDNACKWGRAGVRVASEEVDGRVIVMIDDDGPGLEEGLRDRVLQRGVRADEAAPGSGLGLAIVRDLVDVYGGTIALVPSPLGGLRAVLTLPAAGV
jgi:signal transduction histidine kinase